MTLDTYITRLRALLQHALPVVEDRVEQLRDDGHDGENERCPDCDEWEELTELVSKIKLALEVNYGAE